MCFFPYLAGTPTPRCPCTSTWLRRPCVWSEGWCSSLACWTKTESTKSLWRASQGSVQQEEGGAVQPSEWAKKGKRHAAAQPPGVSEWAQLEKYNQSSTSKWLAQTCRLPLQHNYNILKYYLMYFICISVISHAISIYANRHKIDSDMQQGSTGCGVYNEANAIRTTSCFYLFF